MINEFLRGEIDAGSFPGAVYAIGSYHRIEAEKALGHAVAVPLRVRADLDTIYDCASITKPLITATLSNGSGVERRRAVRPLESRGLSDRNLM